MFPNTVFSYFHDSQKDKPCITKNTFSLKDIPDGYGAFFSPNGFASGVRQKDVLTDINAVYVDIDHTSITKEELLMEFSEQLLPTIINQTKNGYHCFWLLDESVDVDDTNRDELTEMVEGINRRLIALYKGDNAASDVTRLLRIPGTEHRKDIDSPFIIKTVYEVGANTYSLKELTDVFEPISKISNTVVHGEMTGDATDAIKFMLTKPHVRVLWDGEVPEDRLSESDQSLCNHLAFWLQKDPVEMEKAWLSSKLGQREKTQTRKDYRDRTINNAIARTNDVYVPKVVAAIPDKVIDISLDDLMSVTKGDKVAYLTNDENIIRVLSHYKVAKYDEFRNRAYLLLDGEWKVRNDGSDGLMYSWLVTKFPFLAIVTSRKVSELLTVVQYRHTFDSAQDYVNGLTWDGESRLDNWLNKVFYVGEESYHKDIGSKWWMGMVARILKPGCKFDNVLLVQGGQELGKSLAFLTIAGSCEQHVEFTDLKVKEMQQDMQGKLIVEFAEAAIFSKADSETLKSVVSRQTDTFRIPWEKHARDFPRRCVFAVSANNDDILKDTTGGRRWWTVDLPEDMKVYPPKRTANIDWLKENRDQLFAEAAVRFNRGDEFWKVDAEELRERQKSITSTEQDEDLFFDWYQMLGETQQDEGVSIRGAYVGAYKVDYHGDKLREDAISIKKADEMRVGRILRKIGLEKKKSHGKMLWFQGDGFEGEGQKSLPKTVHEEF